jgi:hypothetical protein
MATVYRFGLMAHALRASGEKTMLKVKENSFILMEILMKETG